MTSNARRAAAAGDTTPANGESRPAERKASAGSRRKAYSSPQILARRRRILEETRNLISEQGLTSFSMDELCRRAGVAKRTLYNAFQSREHMMAVAIGEYFADFASRLHSRHPPGSLAHMIEWIVAVATRGREIFNYNRALMAVYHSPEVDPDIWTTIHRIATETHRPYVDSLKSRRLLQPWVDVEALVDDLARYRYATGNDWCNGRIADQDYVPRLLTGMLAMLAGSARGAGRKEIEAALADLRAQSA